MLSTKGIAQPDGTPCITITNKQYTLNARYLPIVEEALKGLDLPNKMPVIVRQVR